jgi:hypothetical protein
MVSMNRKVGEARDLDPNHAPVITDPEWYRRTYGKDSIPVGVQVVERVPVVSGAVVNHEVTIVEVTVPVQTEQGQQAA